MKHYVSWQCERGLYSARKGEKRTPTQRKLTSTQIQEARELVGSCLSLRQVVSRLGISHQALKRLLERNEN